MNKKYLDRVEFSLVMSFANYELALLTHTIKFDQLPNLNELFDSFTQVVDISISTEELPLRKR